MTRAEELTAKLLDRTLSEDEWAELEALLSADPAALAEHLALLELEAVLRGLRSGFDLSGPAMEKVKAAQAERTAAAVMAEIATLPRPAWSPRPAPRRGLRRRLPYAAAAAAVAAALLVGVWLGTRPLEDNPAPPPGHTDPAAFARLTTVVGPVELLGPGGEVTPAEAGRAVTPGHTLRTPGEDSLAVVEFADRTTMEIEPGTVVQFTAENPAAGLLQRVFLASGQLTAAVPERPADSRPMVVSTPSADVLTRGGRFVVTSAGPDSARVESKQGSVQVVRPLGPKPVFIGAGGAAVIAPGFDSVAVEASPRVDGRPRRALQHGGTRDAVFSPDGKQVWIASGRHLTWWTADGGTGETQFFKKGPEGLAAQFSRDRTALVTFRGDKDDGLVVRDLPGGAERAVIPTRIADPRALAVGPGAAWVATVEPRPNHRRFHVWDGTTGTERFARDVEEGITCLTASPDGRVLALGVTDVTKGTLNKVVFFDPATGDRHHALPTQKRGLSALAFSADGRFLAAGVHGQVQVWDVRGRELLRTITGFERVVGCLAFSPDGKRLAAGTQDGQVWVWQAATGKLVQRIDVGSRGLRSVAFSPDGRALVTAANNAPVAIWDVPAEGQTDAGP